MLWELYVEKKKQTRNGKSYGLLLENVFVACLIASYEGEMAAHARIRHWTNYALYQGRVRCIFEKEFPNEEIPKELEHGYQAWVN